MGLSNKQRAFIEEYLIDFNATQAAKRAGYAGNDATLASVGSENLRKPEISKVIETRLQEKQMSADEALQLLADMARGDLGDFMDISSVGFNLDLLNEDGTKKNTKLIRKIKQKTTTFIAKKESDEDREVTETEIELYDAQAAIDKILKIHGKYKDIEIGGNIKVLVEYANGNRNDPDAT